MATRPAVLRFPLARSTAVLAVAAALSGCAAGPDFVRPAPASPPGYLAGSQPVALGAGEGEPAQRLADGKAIEADWWRLFGSPPLQGLVEQAIAGNYTLAAAKATLVQAHEAVKEARAAYWPWLDAGFQVQGEANVFRIGPTVSYMPDVFGLTRRRVEQQQALADSQRYQVAAAWLALTGNTVMEAINAASLHAQIAAVEDIIAQDEKDVDLVRRRYEAGKVARADLLTAESILANDKTLLAPLRQQWAVSRDALCVLVGTLPGECSPPDLDLTGLQLPGELPLSLPSAFARQRPDILAAEAQMHAANAAVGISVAEMYPSVTLSASGGFESDSLSSLIEGSKLAWSLASGVSVPVFHGGAQVARNKGAIAAYDATFATYRQVVVEAFAQVADTLQALEHDAELVEAQKKAFDVSSASLALQREIYRAGKADLLQLLTAERAYQQARLGYVKALGQRHLDTAQLFVALGGGWWDAPEAGSGG